MAFEEGIVTGIEESYAMVKVVRSVGCAHCPSAGSCHIESDRVMLVRARNIAGAKIGQRVKLFIPPGSVLEASFLLYLVPLFGLLIGAVVGKLVVAPFSLYLSSEVLAAGIGLITMAGIFLGIRFYDKRHRQKEKYIPKITQII